MNANSKQREWALTETWEDVEKLIYSTANKFIAKYGTPEFGFDDVIGVGYDVFMRITNPNDPVHYRRGKGSFSNWLYFKYWHTLLEAKEKEALNHSRCPRDWSVDVARYQVAGEPRPGRLMELLDELPTDARIVARLALEAPADVRLLVAGEKDEIKSMRAAIRTYLMDAGWDVARVERCFQQLADVLAGRPVVQRSWKPKHPPGGAQLQLF